jgi:nucleotide-binding universal stress UspA family protein
VALARALGAKVTAYCALEGLQTMYVEGYAFDQEVIDGFEKRARAVGQKHADAIGKMAKAAGVPFAAVVTEASSAYEGFIDAAKKQKCDVIFMASHGRRGLSKLIMGSVTQKVLTHSKIPVVVYRLNRGRARRASRGKRGAGGNQQYGPASDECVQRERDRVPAPSQFCRRLRCVYSRPHFT